MCEYKKRLEDVVWLPIRQLFTRDQNYTDINNYMSPNGLQQWVHSIPQRLRNDNSNEKTNGSIYVKKNEWKTYM